ncbi:jhamt [Trichonephila clavata]|uniref:Jhamt n=1 Tax=Trichonephila clavata TaxID=2740835 RepID=A0A8X6FR16_TRICU|nr:jhamt [Trichonephila clavata]
MLFAQYDFSIQFVQRCADEFQWEDLSEDVVMDIGCGHELNCCKAIMMQFPEVKALIAVDKESTVFETERFRNRIEFCVGDIQERDSLKSYEGQMDKDTFALNLYAPEHGKQYKEHLEKIGFKHVRAFEEEIRLPFSSDECFKDFLEDLNINLKLSPEDAESSKRKRS